MKTRILVIGSLALGVMIIVAVIYRVLTSLPTVSGTVYLDINANGKQDAGEQGMPAIPVSNGQRVVLTDEQGSYKLPLESGQIIFVVKPAEYHLGVDHFGKPRFYHLAGDGVDDRSGTDLSHDFALQKTQDVGDNFSMLVFGDPQPYSETQVEYYRKDIIADVQDPHQYRFGISLGDIVGDRPDLYPSVAEATSRLGIPWWYVIGNHDLEADTQDEDSARQSFRNIFGPTVYAFNEGKVHFIVLDSMKWIGPGARNFVGGLSERQLNFIEDDLAHVPMDRLIVLAMHIPPLGEWIFQGKFQLEDRKRLFELLAGRKVLTLAAHTHSQWRLDFESAHHWESTEPHHLYIVGTTSGNWWQGLPRNNGLPDPVMVDGTPNGYAIIHFDGRDYRMDWKVSGRPDEYRMRVHGPAAITSADGAPDQTQDRYFYVNYFMGYYSADRVSTPVEYRQPGGEWKPMVPSFEADPYRLALDFPWFEAQWQEEKKPPGKRPKAAAPSLHLWKAQIPSHGEPGKRVLEIRVTETDGRQFFSKYHYEIIPATQPGT